MFRTLRLLLLAAVPAALIAITPATADAARRRHHRYDGHRYHQRYDGWGYNYHPQRYYYYGYQPYTYYGYQPYTYRNDYRYSPYGGYYYDHGYHQHYGVRTPWGSVLYYDD